MNVKSLSDDDILKIAHRTCKKYTHKGDEPYSFDDGCMIHFVNAILKKCATMDSNDVKPHSEGHAMF